MFQVVDDFYILGHLSDAFVIRWWWWLRLTVATLSVLGEQWGTATAQLLGGGQVTSGSTVKLERFTDGGMSGV